MLANVSRQGLLKGMCLRPASGRPLGSGLAEKAGWRRRHARWLGRQPECLYPDRADGRVTLSNRAEWGRASGPVLPWSRPTNWARTGAGSGRTGPSRSGTVTRIPTARAARHWYDPMRHAGAAARLMLEQAAANQWDVPVSPVRTGVHKVVHPATGRELGFGELARARVNWTCPAGTP